MEKYMENSILDALRREGRPMEPDALMQQFEGNEEKEKAAAAVSRMLADGRLMLTKKKKLALPEQTGLIYGRIQGNARGFGFFIPEDGSPDMFVPAESMHGAMHSDKVWVRATEQLSRNGSPEAEVALIAERAQSKIVGTYEKDNVYGGYIVPDDTRIYLDLFVHDRDVSSAKNGDKVVAQITQYPDGRRPPTGKIVEVLGGKHDAGTDMLSVIRRLDLPDSFTKPELKLARSINVPVDEDETVLREDIRAWKTITIDGADAKDLDDAVSLKKLKNGNYLLGVHIADVSHYISEGSALDKEAYKRGTSVYFPDRVLPMFPPDISNGVCSLNEGTDKLTLSCFIEVDKSGKTVNHRIAETVIRTAHRMNYDEVNAIFAGDAKLADKYADVVPMLEEMRVLQDILHTERVKRGSIDFDLDEAKITLDKNGIPTEVKLYERGVSNRMIEEFMLLANETVATHARDMSIPLMYRVHETPDKEKLEALNTFLGTMGYGIKNIANVRPITIQKVLIKASGTKEENVISRVTLRSMRKARYADECLGHFGLALENYTHFTSPIRRYPDLIVHRVMKDMLHGRLNKAKLERWAKYMPEAAKHLSEREVVAVEAERAADDIKKCEYMRERIGTVESGVISGVIQYGFFVELGNTVEGMVKAATLSDDFYVYDEKHYRMVGRSGGRVYRLGDTVRVKVAVVDMESARIEFVLYSDTDTAGMRREKKPAQGAKKQTAADKNGESTNKNTEPKPAAGAQAKKTNGRSRRKQTSHKVEKTDGK